MTASLLEQLADLPKAEADALIRALAPDAAAAFEYHWRYRARLEQLPPEGSWRVWLLMAGRGFGKTRCGAEWVRAEVKAGRRRIALVAPTAADARDVMVEGELGILAISPDHERPLYEPSKRRLTWPNGAIATTYSADEPERLRGPQHDAAWCDELGSWRFPEAWDMLMFGLRLGTDPRIMVTTTPRPTRLIRSLVDDPKTAITRGTTYANRANLAGAFLDQIVKKYEDLLRLSRQCNDSAGIVLGHDCSGRDLLLAGRFASSRSHFEEVLALYDPISHGSLVHQTGSHPGPVSQGYLGIALFCLGFPDQALARSNAAIAEALAHPPTLTVSLAQSARLLSLTGDNAPLDERAAQLIAVATEQSFPLYRVLGTIYRGWAKVNTGEVAEGISLLRSGSSAYSATGAETRISFHIGLLAKASEIAGQVEEALSLLDDALQNAERIGERWFAAELYRHKGQLMLRQGDSEAAEQLYRKALSIAQEQEAKLWELRAARDLARLWAEHGRRTEARDLLAPVYGWFTEGFNTADLKEAKALLDELT